MNQYYSELLATSSLALSFIIVIFLGLYLVYYLKKSNYDGFNNFLNCNKIYIELFLVICLSFMSIIVATNANVIAVNELNIQKANNQPIFVFDEIRYGNGYYEKLLVYNRGAPVNNFFISPITILKVHGRDTNNKLKEITIPIGYYDISTRSGNDSSELQEFFASDTEPLNGNHYRLSESFGDLYTISRDNNLSIGMSFYKYLYITYEDMYGDEHNDLYLISDLYPHKVSGKDKEKLLHDFHENVKYGYFLDINDLKAEKIYNIFVTSY